MTNTTHNYNLLNYQRKPVPKTKFSISNLTEENKSPSYSKTKKNFFSIVSKNDQQLSKYPFSQLIQQKSPPNKESPFNDNLLNEQYIPKIDKTKVASKSIGSIISYCFNTHQGLVRNYNEDKISININMIKPPNKDIGNKQWPNVSFFSIFDGHGGSNCAEFLRDQLHNFIIKDEQFPQNPKQAIINGFKNADEQFLKKAENSIQLDRSGSCVITLMILNNVMYIANLGDSRAVLSTDNGEKVIPLSIDHKPNNPEEEKRIIANGGRIYQRQIPYVQPGGSLQYICGPHRVLPGRLAVSRSMGDAEAKLKKYGGNYNVITYEPEIQSLMIQDNQDFIILGCDGVFDKLENEQCIQFVWEKINQLKNNQNINLHDIFGQGIEFLMKQCFLYKSFDNISIVGICLKDFRQSS